jgi:hypothetical protein
MEMEVMKRMKLRRACGPKLVTQPTCPRCGLPAKRSGERDAYFCPVCNQWLEGKCGDPDCEFCAGRPARPLQSEAMKTEIVEKTLARLLFYPESNRLVAHLYDASTNLKCRASVETYGAGGFRPMVVSLLAALRAMVESDPTL